MADTFRPGTTGNPGGVDTRTTSATPAEDARTIMINQVSLSAVLGGVVVGLVTQLILNMIGIGIGASALEPGTGSMQNPTVSGLSIGAGVWWTMSLIIASLVGGFAAGRLAGKPDETAAGWHGLTAWALTTLVIFYLATSAIGGVVGGAYRAVSSATSGVTSTAGSAAQTAAMSVADPFSTIEQSVRYATAGNDPAVLREAATSAIRAALTGNPAQAAEAREKAAAAIAKAQNIPVEQARTEVQRYEQQYRQAVESAKTTAVQAQDVAATAVTRGALFGALALLLGAAAGWFGGRMGAVESTITERLKLRRFVG